MAVAGPRRMMWAVEMAVIVMGLLAMASPTMQLSMKNPLRGAIQKINDIKLPVYAIIVTATSSEKAFNESVLQLSLEGKSSLARYKMWSFKVAVVVLGLLAMAEQSMQLSVRHTLHGVIRKINEEGPYLGLVLVSDTNEQALQASNVFVPGTYAPTVALAGRTFHVGKINGTNVNAAATVQLLIDVFPIEGIVHFGSAGAVNDTLFIGDVVVPSQVAFTGSWQWKKFESKKGQLRFGDYNNPTGGENLLGSIDFQPTSLYTPEQKQTIFWLPINSSWFVTATQLQNVEMQQCLDTDRCLPRSPEIVYGVRTSTADMYIQNAAYREYIYAKFKASTVDEESAAVALVALSNEVPFIVFRGVSNTAGGSTAYKSYSYLGSVNALNAAVAFIGAVGSSGASRANY
ncbi:hypothetical protein GH714_020458 [Hevea brasiliensis]|uniref:Nucleoside phosphorylase domain-containing protein n=1 Tax=Hevea brasiliensis TaxID=3981 RepID=A0A6A6M2D8_HEVBR|nr:hypothetical protein GH714_020458 [Hevea brasiliensis]